MESVCQTPAATRGTAGHTSVLLLLSCSQGGAQLEFLSHPESVEGVRCSDGGRMKLSVISLSARVKLKPKSQSGSA